MDSAKIIGNQEFQSQLRDKGWEEPFDLLRTKWYEVPGSHGRCSSRELLQLSDAELLEYWSKTRKEATSGTFFDVRGWYHLLYGEILRGKKVMDVGSGFGIDGLTFAQRGAEVTFVDIVQTNLAVLRRLCSLLDINDASFCYMENLESLAGLPDTYDTIWCQGSLINAPFEIIRAEIQELVKHLRIGGRWIELAYPQVRWEREGCMSFESWGEKTDGGAPWMEWYDLPKLLSAMQPYQFETVLYFEFHNADFNWFDLLRTA